MTSGNFSEISKWTEVGMRFVANPLVMWLHATI